MPEQPYLIGGQNNPNLSPLNWMDSLGMFSVAYYYLREHGLTTPFYLKFAHLQNMLPPELVGSTEKCLTYM